MNMTARQIAVANENRSIDESAARATAARPRNALEAMASRLEVSAQELKVTLAKTVFKECRSESEFLALIVVANEYGLNPLTKEIYAFPAKGGGVVPMVSVDGWIKLMNSHPMFDGIEFVNHLDEKSKVEAIEAIIFRKDRTHPIKVIEYLEECKRNTEPWNKMERRMLRNRSLIQGARIAFGFTGIVSDDDEVIDGGVIQSVSLPRSDEIAAGGQADAEPHDAETGEVLSRDPQTGMTQVTEEEARRLDAGTEVEEGSAADPVEGRATQDMGEAHTEAEVAAQTVADIDGPLEEDDKPAWWGKVQWLREAIAAARNKQYLKDADHEFTTIRAGLPDEVIAEIEELLAARRVELTRSAGGAA